MKFDIVTEKLKSISEGNQELTDLVSLIENGTVIFLEGFSQNKDRLASLYDWRHSTAENSEKTKLSEESLNKWKKAVDQLKEDLTDNARLNVIMTHNKTFVFFWNENSGKFISYFSSPSLKVEDNKDLVQYFVANDLGKSYDLYIKAKLQE